MKPHPNYVKIEETITKWLDDYLQHSGCKGFMVAISGGLDSSVTAVLCRKVTDSTLGLILPCAHTPPDSAEDAISLANQFDITYRSYDLTAAYEFLLSTFGIKKNASVTIPMANIKARLRMVSLYFEANRLNRLVVGTGNRTEILLGFFTKYGDGGVDLLPLGNLLKREVRGLATHLGIPQHIIAKIPSPGLWPGQTDEGELGATYDQIDDLISNKTPQGLTTEEIDQIKSRITSSEHKRKLPPICTIR